MNHLNKYNNNSNRSLLNDETNENNAIKSFNINSNSNVNTNKKSIEDYEKRLSELEHQLEFFTNVFPQLFEQYSTTQTHENIFLTKDCPQDINAKDEENTKLKLKCTYLDNQASSLRLLNDELKKKVSCLYENNQLLDKKHKETKLEYQKNFKAKEEKVISLSSIIIKLKQKVIQAKREQHDLENIVIEQERKLQFSNNKIMSLLMEVNRKVIHIKDCKMHISSLESCIRDIKGRHINGIGLNRYQSFVVNKETKSLREQIEGYQKEIEILNLKIRKYDEENTKAKPRPLKKNNSISYPVLQEETSKRRRNHETIHYYSTNLEERKKIVDYTLDNMMSEKEDNKIKDFKTMLNQLINDLG